MRFNKTALFESFAVYGGYFLIVLAPFLFDQSKYLKFTVSMTKECCHVCGGEKWVCENHPENPWNDGYPGCCGGAGIPCQACNKDDIPKHPPGSVVTWSAFNKDDETVQ